MSQETFRNWMLMIALVVASFFLMQISQNGRYQVVICGSKHEVCAVLDTHTGTVDFAKPREGAEAAQK